MAVVLCFHTSLHYKQLIIQSAVNNTKWSLTKFWGTGLFAVAPCVLKPRVANHSALAMPGAALATTSDTSIVFAPAFGACYGCRAFSTAFY